MAVSINDRQLSPACKSQKLIDRVTNKRGVRILAAAERVNYYHVRLALYCLIFFNGSVEASSLGTRNSPAQNYELIARWAKVAPTGLLYVTPLLCQSQAHGLRDLVVLITPISTDRQPVAEQQPGKERDEADGDLDIHWWEVLCWFVMGVLIGSGAFLPRRKLKHKPSSTREHH